MGDFAFSPFKARPNRWVNSEGPMSNSERLQRFREKRRAENPPPKSHWDEHPEHLGIMKDMRSQGAGAREIANKLGISTNAVIGKWNREGMSKKTKVDTKEHQQPSLPRLSFLEKPYEED